jgi:hypothetical protein
MNNNTAFVSKIGNFKSIEGADKIIQASVILNNVPITQVVVGKDDYKENDLVVYFDSNLCIDQIVVDAIDKQSQNYGKDDFQSLSRYFAKGNRVKTVKLRGCISDGLVLPIEKFFVFFKNDKDATRTLIEGYDFNDIYGAHICHKYVPSVRQQQVAGNKNRKKKKLISRVIPEMFNFHCDTAQILKNISVLGPNRVASLSRKIHGTSFICSNTKVLKKLSFVEKILKKLNVSIVDKETDYLYSSRTVIKNDLLNGTGFYSVNVWQDAGEKFFKGKLHNGETIYGEIVGYLPGTQTFIQKPFDYGCNEGEYKIAVYRITLTSDDGTVAEYSWNAMKERCSELNVPMVEEYFYGRLGDMYPDIVQDENWATNFVQRLQDVYLEKDCPLCKNKVPDEGIVIRFDALKIEPYKLKSKRFILKESELKEKDDFTDIESCGDAELATVIDHNA